MFSLIEEVSQYSLQNAKKNHPGTIDDLSEKQDNETSVNYTWV